jgi:2-methylisocitrate lyase-like PEP mutase family enzyme
MRVRLVYWRSTTHERHFDMAGNDRTRNEERRRAFKALHAAPNGFVMPNAWDAGTAAILTRSGVAAIATTSAGIAFSLGRPDYDVRDAHLAIARDAMFERVGEIVAVSDIPANGDLEAGYGAEPADVAETIRLAIDVGLAGGNIEDKNPRTGELFDDDRAAERIRAAREAIDARGSAFVLTARTDVFLTARGDAEAAIRRAKRYRDAGADVIYPAGVADLETVRRLVREIDAPLNVVVGLAAPTITPRALLGAGVQRVSTGGSIARAALALVAASARELLDHGTIDYASRQLSQLELNLVFAAVRSAER